MLASNPGQLYKVIPPFAHNSTGTAFAEETTLCRLLAYVPKSTHSIARKYPALRNLLISDRRLDALDISEDKSQIAVYSGPILASDAFDITRARESSPIQSR